MFLVTGVIMAILKLCGVAIPLAWWGIAIICAGDILLVHLITLIRGFK